jgi:hypothetical protein
VSIFKGFSRSSRQAPAAPSFGPGSVLALVGQMNAISDGGAQPISSDPTVRRVASPPLPPGAGAIDPSVHAWPPKNDSTSNGRRTP